jgi:glycosyltransferase involved in cell wall biosynthesis
MIITVIHFTDSDSFGGTEQALLHTLAGLDRQRWQPVLFHHGEPGIDPLLRQAKDRNVKLRTVPRMQTVRDLHRLPEFIGAIRSERPVVFHAHLTWPLSCKYGLLAAILARVPAIVATVQLYLDPPKKRSVHTQLRFIAGRVDRYLAVSHAVATQLSHALDIPPRKLEVVHNGIPLPVSQRPAMSRLRNLLPCVAERPIVLTTARLEGQKGHRYLLEAAAQHPEAMFVLAGEGSERARLEAQAKELRLADRIVFLGYRADVRHLLDDCDLFVLPSLNEGLPLSILEAMAASKPVIATSVGGTAEVIVNGETGLLVPPADPTALAGAIRAVLSTPQLAERLAMGGAARVRQFSADKMVGDIMRVYDELTNRPELPVLDTQGRCTLEAAGTRENSKGRRFDDLCS